MLLVSSLKNLEANPLDERFLEILPENCDVCGSKMSITQALTTLSCSNPRCEDKVVARLVAALETLGVKGIGDEIASAYVHEKRVINPLNILWESGNQNLCEGISYVNWKKVHEQIEKKNSKGYLLHEVVQLLSIPGVQTSAEVLFASGNLDLVYEKLETEGTAWVQRTLGIHAEGGVSTRAVNIYRGLMLYKEDLYDAVSHLKIKEKAEGVPELVIVCSTAVGAPFKTKRHFEETLKELLDGVVNLKFAGSVTKKTDYLVWSGADGSPAPLTGKVKTALKLNEREETVAIVTGQQLVTLLEKDYLGKGE